MIGREIGLRLLQRVVEESAADETEAILMTEDSSLTRFADSSVHQHVAEKNQTVILRIVMGKKVSVVTTNVLAAAPLRATLKRAIALANARPPLEDFRSLPVPKPIPPATTYFKGIKRLTPDRKVKILGDALAILGEKGVRASGAFSQGEVELAVVNSRGVEAFQEFSDVTFHLIADDGKTTGYAAFASRDPGQLSAESLAKEALEKLSRGEPVQVEPGEYEVVLEPYAVHEFLTFMAFLGFHALSVQEGRSFFCGRFGRKLADEKVTIYDDALDPAGLPVPFDFEGSPKERVTFFEKGVAAGVTFDSLTAAREGKESTGHALPPPSTEGPVPVNLFMEAGNSSLQEMVASVRKGIYVTRFHYTNVAEPMKAVITGMTRDGTFLIEDGEIKRPVKNLRFTESILAALSRTTAVSRERKVCSEGAGYGRRFVTGTVVPALKVDGFHFSGVSAL
jgi:PmbA protein